jgi:uncharacterized membrane protein
VLDADGNPRKGVKVTVRSADGEYSAETDDAGIYRFENMEPGEYDATVEEEGYEGAESRLTIGGNEEASE